MAEPLRRSPGRPRLSEQRAPTEETLLAAASRLFLDRGYELVTMDEVAEAAGVTKATVYYHYASKADLFTAAMAAMLRQMEQRTRSILQSPDLTLRERLLRVAALRLAGPEGTMDFETLVREARSSLTLEQMRTMREALESITAAVAETLAEGMRRQELRPLDPALGAHAFFALLSSGWLHGPDGSGCFEDSDAHANRLMDLLWRGLAAAGA